MSESASLKQDTLHHMGVFVGVVGASGAGKDSVIRFARQALAGDGRFVFPRRVVTRADGSAEDSEEATHDDFLQREAEGAFVLSWRAHGLSYGIPSSVNDDIRSMRIVTVNISREVIPLVRERFKNFRIVEIVASAAVVERRLAARGRETHDDIVARIVRNAAYTNVPSDMRIHNDNALEEAGRNFIGFLLTSATSVLFSRQKA